MSAPDSAARFPGYSAFISYASEADRETAFRIVEHLEASGLKCWIAPRNVRAGKQYAEEIVRGIRTSQGFILLLSKAANGSKFVRREVEQADRRDKPIYAIRIEEVDPSDGLQLFLSEIHWIDAWAGDLGAHVKQLAEMLREEEGLPETRPDPQAETLTPKTAPPLVARAKPTPRPLEQETRVERKPETEAAPQRLTKSLPAKSWLFAVRGALALATGAALISDGQYSVTDESLAGTGSLLAAYLITDGVLAVATGIKWPGGRWGFASLAEGVLSFLGAASLSAGYEPMRVAVFFVLIAAARGVAALRMDARDGRWSLLTSAACSFGFAFVFVAAAMGADHMVWGSTYLTTWGLLLFAVGAAFLSVAFHLAERRREHQSADGLAQVRSATVGLARAAPAFAAAGVALIAVGVPFLLWWLLPASPAWNVFGTPFAAMAAIAVGILLYGVLALVSGLRLDRASRLRLPFILYGAASVLLGASTFADLFTGPYPTFTPSEALYIADPLDRFFGAWGLWALVTGGLLLVLAASIDDGKFRLAGAAVALLAVGFFLLLAALDFTAQESMFLFWMGTVTIIAGVIHIRLASTLRTYAARPGVSAHA